MQLQLTEGQIRYRKYRESYEKYRDFHKEETKKRYMDRDIETWRTYHREYYREYFRLNPEKRVAKMARKVIHRLVKSGRLTRSTRCGSCLQIKFTEGHHQDYNNPKDVIWLCKSCHETIHHKK